MNWLIERLRSARGGAPVRAHNPTSRANTREMRRLAFLVGEWIVECASSDEPYATCYTTWSGRGDYILMHLHFTPDPGHFHPSLSLIGFDQHANVYRRWDFFPTGTVPEEWEGRFEDKQLVFTVTSGNDEGVDAAEELVGRVGLMQQRTPTSEGYFEIIWVAPDHPADRAGLRRGDLLLQIDDRSVIGLTYAECQEHISGPPGTVVRLGIRSAGRDRQVTLARWREGGSGRREIFTPRGKDQYSHALYLRRGDRFEGGEGIFFTRTR